MPLRTENVMGPSGIERVAAAWSSRNRMLGAKVSVNGVEESGRGREDFKRELENEYIDAV